MIPVFPWPPPVPIPDAIRAFPGSPQTVLAIAKYPPWVCDVVVATSPESLPAAIDAALNNRPTFTKADYLRVHLGAQELTGAERFKAESDYEMAEMAHG